MIFFTKMHGLGNDYIFINCLDRRNMIETKDLPQIARYFSNRNFGIGGDGIILIDKSNIADFKMRIFNSDGSEAQMCGNGIRCFAKYVFENKMIHKKNIKIETLCGIKTAKIVQSKMNKNIQEIKVDMGAPIFEPERIPVITEKKESLVKLNFKKIDRNFQVYCVSIGNPHAVVITENIEKIDVHKFGKAIEEDSHFPEKTNVEFIQVLDRSNIKMKVWERGSGETFACGTGACASSIVCNKLGLTKDEVTVHLKGGDLCVEINKEENKVYMTGIATKVFDGYIDERVIFD